MLQSLVTQLGAGAVLVVCLYALIAGGWRERFGAVIYLAAYLISVGFALISPDYTTLYLLVADALCLQGYLVISWKSPYSWPKWAVAGQLVCVAAEVVTLMPQSLLSLGIHTYVFLSVETAAGWAVLLALLLGTIAAAQTRRDARRLPRTE